MVLDKFAPASDKINSIASKIVDFMMDRHGTRSRKSEVLFLKVLFEKVKCNLKVNSLG